jgi:hypothetical protein
VSRSEEVDPHHAVPGRDPDIDRSVLDPVEVAAVGGDSRIVDEHREPSERCKRFLDDPARRISVADVPLDQDMARSRKARERLLCVVAAACVVHGDAVASSSERERRGTSDATRRAGDQDAARLVGRRVRNGCR